MQWLLQQARVKVRTRSEQKGCASLQRAPIRDTSARAGASHHIARRLSDALCGWCEALRKGAARGTFWRVLRLQVARRRAKSAASRPHLRRTWRSFGSLLRRCACLIVAFAFCVAPFASFSAHSSTLPVRQLATCLESGRRVDTCWIGYDELASSRQDEVDRTVLSRRATAAGGTRSSRCKVRRLACSCFCGPARARPRVTLVHTSQCVSVYDALLAR